jgi:hypothetical protein
MIELGLFGLIQLYIAFTAQQAQQKPHLFLAYTHRLLAIPNQALRQTIAQPSAGMADDFNMMRLKTDFLGEFPKHGLFRRFINVDAPLGKLP